MSNKKVDSISIRMYNTGSVGDCFLIRFYKENAVTFSMLIDCGGYNTTAAAIIPCVEDIKTTCNSKLDLLVVTHEHEDHVCGFNLARDVFEEISVDQVWMSWAENPSDAIAKKVKTKYGKKLKELVAHAEMAQAKLKKSGMSKSKYVGQSRRLANQKLNNENVLELLKFEMGTRYAKKQVAGRRTNADAMKYVKRMGNKLTYLKPGDVVKGLSGAEGIKFFILGPPRDSQMTFLKIETNEDEMYSLAKRYTDTGIKSTEGIVNSGTHLETGRSPFDEGFHLNGAEAARFMKLYNSNEEKWRQIETDWLEANDEQAIALTRLINNTSLAMAIEVEEMDSVLLFPADAQSGNWMSWHQPDVMTKLKANGNRDTDELLSKTIFYKVGHHCSHNGTASKSGLDLIPDTNLVAFVPLVQDKVPSAWGGSENFPAKKLNKVLVDKTKGRLVRTDIGVVNDANAKLKRSQLPKNELKKFTDNISQGSCYYEYVIVK